VNTAPSTPICTYEGREGHVDGSSRPPSSAGSDLTARRERFGRVTDPHVESLIRFARHLVWSPERAEDAVQEALLRAWQYFDSYDHAGNARMWLFTILRRVIYDASARTGREREKTTAMVEDPPARAESDRLVAVDVEEAIAKLPAELREVFLLCVVERLKYREAADAIGVPIGTVMSRLFRARGLLRWYLREYVEERGRHAEEGEAPGATGVA
jgi:RNA polymerase sigma-70 factor (ECF subfamily)